MITSSRSSITKKDKFLTNSFVITICIIFLKIKFVNNYLNCGSSKIWKFAIPLVSKILDTNIYTIIRVNILNIYVLII